MKLSFLSKNISLAVFSLFLSNMAIANEKNPKIYVDVYKSKQVTAEKIYEQLKPEFDEVAVLLLKKGGCSKADLERMNPLMTKIYSVIEKSGKFSFVSVSPVLYGNGKPLYITIDLVDEADKKRLEAFSKNPDQNIKDPYHLIASWQKYEKDGFDEFLKNKVVPKKIPPCSAFHCIFGFESPERKKYQIKFDKYVPLAKNDLVNILKNDKDGEKRAAAAYLLAHLKDGKEIIRLLIPSIRDSSGSVRNNAMRVLGATLEKVKDADFPVQEAITALDFPMGSDRNKALYVLLSLASQPRYAEYITKHASTQLMDELKLYQLNLHDTAYSVLKKISGKNYAERDYQSWELWLKNHQ